MGIRDPMLTGGTGLAKPLWQAGFRGKWRQRRHFRGFRGVPDLPEAALNQR
jgi:hypothetical protein